MMQNLINLLTHNFTVVLVFACLVAYNYIRDLRRERDDARREAKEAWRIYERTNGELCRLQGKPVPPPFFNEDQPQPPAQDDSRKSPTFVPRFIGPTAINDREMQRGRVDGTMRAPVNTPSPGDIAAAINATKNNGELN